MHRLPCMLTALAGLVLGGCGDTGEVNIGPETTATLAFDLADAGHVISADLFGDQIEWINNGMGIWDPDAAAPRAGLTDEIDTMGVNLLRYPGGTYSDFFHWEGAVGPVAGRTPQIDPFTSTAADIVTAAPMFGPDEFATVAAQLGTGIMITVNAGSGTPDEAAAWVQHYKANGVTVTYCEVGNEVYLDADVYALSAVAMTPAEYAAFFNACAAAVRAVDPDVKVGMVGVYYPGWLDTWLMDTLPLITERADFLAVHNSYAGWPTYYEPDDALVFRAVLAAPDYIRANMDATLWIIRTYAQDQNKLMPIAVTEHATIFTPSDADIDHQLAELARNQTLAAALGSAGTYAMFIADPWISIANHINMYSPFWQAALQTEGDYHSNPVRTPFYHVFRMYAETAGGRYIPVSDAGGPVFACEAFGNIPAIADAKALVSSAVLAPSADRVWLYVLNRDLDRDIPARVTAGLDGRTLAAVSAEVLNGPDFTSSNTAAAPDTVRVTVEDLPLSSAFTRTFPAHALTRITFRLE